MKKFFLAIFTVLGMTLAQNLPHDQIYYDYEIYHSAVNHSGITFSPYVQPCFQPNVRCLRTSDYPEKGLNYEIEILNGNSAGICNRKYDVKGKTIFTGQCSSAFESQFLITCRNSKDLNNLPNHNLGWIIINFNKFGSDFWAYQGAKARFDHVSDKQGPWKTQDTLSQQNLSIEILCSSDKTS